MKIIFHILKNLLNEKFINRTCIVSINSIAINYFLYQKFIEWIIDIFSYINFFKVNDKSTLETSYKRDSSIIYFDQNLDSATFLFDYKRNDFSLFLF